MTFFGSASWLNPPETAVTIGRELHVTASRGSDFWRSTLYGFVRHSGHALMVPSDAEGSLEVDFRLDYDHQYDQAGLMICNDEDTWAKAGLEISDNVPHVGAVVTHGVSDWSLAPAPTWAGRIVSVRASWSSGAVIVRARPGGESWQTIRVAPFEVHSGTRVGLYLCSPERSGLEVAFVDARLGPPDLSLHANP